MPLIILTFQSVIVLFSALLTSDVEPQSQWTRDVELQSQSVDLNAPDALERLAASNPKHFREIAEIMDGLSQRPYFETSSWVEANFRAKQVRHSPILLTSLPAQRDFSFTLDNTRYYGRRTQDREGAQVFETRTVR